MLYSRRETMKFLQIGISSAVLVSLLSCSTLGADSKRIDYGAAALQVPSLEVPPDLTMPGGEERYKMPQGEGETPVLSTVEGVATYSDYSKGGAQSRTASAVLPKVQGVHMERNNAQRWLVINEKAENVWPEVKAFWQEIGLTISSEDQAAGVMETGWAENRARIPQVVSHNGFDQEFSDAHSAGERDQYRTRLERGAEELLAGHPKDGVNTEVYITHRGIKQESSAAKGTSQWVASDNDPELEAIMLQRLMVRFGVNETKAASAVAATSALAALVSLTPKRTIRRCNMIASSSGSLSLATHCEVPLAAEDSCLIPRWVIYTSVFTPSFGCPAKSSSAPRSRRVRY